MICPAATYHISDASVIEKEGYFLIAFFATIWLLSVKKLRNVKFSNDDYFFCQGVLVLQ